MKNLNELFGQPNTYDQLNYDKGGKNIQWGKESLFNKWCWENWTATGKRIKPYYLFTSHTKIHPKWIKDLNVKPETLKLLKENIGSMLLTSVLAIFFWICLLRKGDKCNNKQMRPNQTKKHLHREGNYQQNERAAYWMGQDICKGYMR